MAKPSEIKKVPDLLPLPVSNPIPIVGSRKFSSSENIHLRTRERVPSDAASQDSGIQSPLRSASLDFDMRKGHDCVSNPDPCACSICLQADLCEAIKILNEDDDDEFEFKPKLLKTSSFKASKTPPGEVQKRKVVRFADAFGLDLESVRHIMNSEAPPDIPSSALSDLQLNVGSDNSKWDAYSPHSNSSLCTVFASTPPIERNSFFSRMQQNRTEFIRLVELTPLFKNPDNATLISRVNDQNVCLESVMINGLTLTGTVRVKNISFHKKVLIRHTFDAWARYLDVEAFYVPSSHDPASNTDKFSFALFAPHTLQPGAKLEICICYSIGSNPDVRYGESFWDNNSGHNYLLTVTSIERPTSNPFNAVW